MKTHDVLNQAPPLADHDAAQHPVFDEVLTRHGAADALGELHEFGALAGSERIRDLGDLVEKNTPELKTHDRYGHRIDQIQYDPAYHELMGLALGNGLGGAPWRSDDPHAHLLRAAKFTAWQSTDVGHTCPVTMTYAAIPALRHDEKLSAEYEPMLCNGVYDPQFAAPAVKRGLTAGMSMTEKQGGSDVRANTTVATPQHDGTYRLTGHKWFTSAPMGDIFLTLAQAPDGLTCFVLPRVLPDGAANSIALMRLKDKLGNRSNASCELEYDEATGWRLGDEGRGVATIIEMVNMTRLDVTLTSAALMLIGTTRAAHQVSHRRAFGDVLIDKPLMRNVIADLAVEAEASVMLGLWLAALTDRVYNGDGEAAPLRRMGLAVSKYYITKRVGSIWEGSGNVAALDVVRVLDKQPAALEAVMSHLDASRGSHRGYDDLVARLKGEFVSRESLEYDARSLVGDVVIALQASLLIESGHPDVTDAFLATRVERRWGTVYGTLPRGLALDAIIDRATPEAAH